MRPELFTRVLPFDEALRLVLDAASPVQETERVTLSAADGRVAAADVVAPDDVPGFARSAMDGYAVRRADLEGAIGESPAVLTAVGEIFTAQVTEEPLARGTCVAIATGAPLPPGADAVVMVEATSREGLRVKFTAPAQPGQNIGPAGSDLSRGSLVVGRGDVLTPARIGSAAATGATHLVVYRKPSIAALATGDEITQPGEPLRPGHVYDVNSFTMEAVARRHGARVERVESADDSVPALEAVLDRLGHHDAVVFSGGSSVGGHDLLLDAVRTRGEVLFHGIAVKPGKPTLLARLGRTVVFGMPGNPTSCLSNAYIVLVPFLRKVARLPPWQPRTVSLPLARRVRSPPDRHQFYPVVLRDGAAEPTFKSSGDITSMAAADGFIEIPVGVDGIEAGATVVVSMLE